ncbi:cuticle protein 21.3 [Sabethes cyaneus]|uniref:cuticle protein 21.3 n=1 Tax=Sabethes cyaneus TaxID=53552 RepID=UPI00237E61A8|nr:cuticle protein 21.3 [Sabethes cyaneus]
MAFKYIIPAVALLVSCVSAGGPAAYSIAAPSLDYHSVGSSHEHTVKGLYGQNVLSQYAKAVDSAHSSVRVQSSRLSNDGIAYAPHYAAAAYPAAAAAYPAYGHALAAPVVKAAYPAYGHALAPAYGHGLAPAYGHALAPAYGHALAAPLAYKYEIDRHRLEAVAPTDNV